MNVGSIPIHVIRAFDRRGGFTAKRGEEAYAKAGPRFARGLHRRIVADVLMLLGPRPGARVADIGAGPGSLTAAIGEALPGANVVGIEPNRRMLELAATLPTPRNVTFLAGSAEDLPLEDRSVDLVVSALSAHHWDDLAAAVAEIRRVLRARGTARIYDVRFATYTGEELADVRDRLRLSPSELGRTVLQRRFLAPYALIEVTPNPEPAGPPRATQVRGSCR